LRELITSMTLKKLTFSNEEIHQIFNQILHALDYLHNDAKLIHKDLNPNNVMIDIKKNVKVTDFGISNWMADVAGKDNKDLDFSGTLQ